MARLRSLVLLCSVCAGLIAVAGAPTLAGQNPPAAGGQTPLFRGGVELVALDFLAVDAQGRPVTTLKPDEVTLKVDGKTRKVQVLQFFKLATTSAEKPVAAPALPPPYATNGTLVPGRAVIVVVDSSQMGPGEGKSAIEAATRLLDRLAPADRVGLVTLPNGRVEVDLTTRHDRVRTALAGLVGLGSRTRPLWNISLSEAVEVLTEESATDQPMRKLLQDRECRNRSTEPDLIDPCVQMVVRNALAMARELEQTTRTSLTALTEFLNGIVAMEGPKSVVFLSSSLIPFLETRVEIGEVARAASVARAQLFVIQPHQAIHDLSGRNETMTIEKDLELELRGLEDLATRTGGVLFRLAGTADNVYTRIADETSAYYLLGFEPSASERDGKRHSIELGTTRPRVTLRTRPGFIIDKKNDPKAAPPPLELTTLLRDVASHRDLPLRATAYAARSADRKQVKIIAVVEPIDPAATLTSAAFALVDISGRVAAQWTEEGAEVIKRPLVSAAELPAGEYRLRVAATDTMGRMGTVDYEFSAGLGDAGPLTLGTLMLGAMERVGQTEELKFRPRLQPDAAAKSVTGYVELYGTPPAGSALSVSFELAASADGPALVTNLAQMLAGDVDRRVAVSSLVLDAVPAGEFVIRAIVRLDGKVVGRALRTLRKPAR